jgi:hypothetical protein
VLGEEFSAEEWSVVVAAFAADRHDGDRRRSRRQLAEQPALGEATVRELRDALRGELVLPGDGASDEARSVWDGMIDRRPALIVRCTGTSDVIAAVGFARSEGLTVAVRGGGHNVAGNATCDGGLVIDLSPMKGVRVDAESRTVRAQGGLGAGSRGAS